MPSRTKTLSAIAGTLLIALCLGHGEMLVPHALAVEDRVVTDVQGDILNKLLFYINHLNVGAFFALKLISWLSNPDIIFGINSNTGILLRLWQISRDIMNMIFAIILLIGAIMTIVFAKRDIVNERLKKFPLAVILVNFSWFFPRVIFDIANVTTATIYNLPRTVTVGSASVSTAPCVWRDGTGTQQRCIVMTDVTFHGSTATCPTSIVSPVDLGIAQVCFALYDGNANTAFGIINGLVLNHGRLAHLGLIVGAPPAGGIGADIKDGLYFGFVLALITFLHVMLVFPLLALAAVMLVRIPVLWMTVAFMPFMFIGFIIGDKFIKVNTMSIFSKHFLTAAFLPTLIAIPFTIGFIMLNAFATIYPAPPPGLGEPFKLVSQVRNWWDLVWVLISFMVIWKGARWAMKSDELYAKFTEPIFNVGTSVMQLPLNAPILPHDTNKDGNFDPKERIGIKDAFRTAQSDKGLANEVFGGLGGPAELPGNTAQNAANDINNRGSKNHVSAADLQKLSDIASNGNEVKDILNKINDSVREGGQPNSTNVTIDAIQKAAAANSINFSTEQLNKIKEELKKSGYTT